MQQQPMLGLHQNMTQQQLQPGQPPPGPTSVAGGPLGGGQMPSGVAYGYGAHNPGPGHNPSGQGLPSQADNCGMSPGQLYAAQMGSGGPNAVPSGGGVGAAPAVDGHSQGMVGVPPYSSMDQQGVAQQQMMMMPQGGYMMAMPPHGGQMPQGTMMMPSGPFMVMHQGMHGNQPVPVHGQQGHGQQHGSPQDAQHHMMMMPMSGGGCSAMPACQHGGAMGQAGVLGQNQASDPEGKGSRVAALNRSAQPKQGAGGWHGADRRGGRPAGAGFGAGAESQGSNAQHYPHGSSMMGAHGPVPGSSSSGPCNDYLFSKRSSKPAGESWADVKDPTHGGVDQDLKLMWGVGDMAKGGRAGVAAHGGSPPTPQAAKGGRMQGQQQSWVPKDVSNQVQTPVSTKGQGKGNQERSQWTPKATGNVSNTPAVAPPAPAKGSGGKKKAGSRRDQEMDTWLNARFAAQGGAPSTPPAPATGNQTSQDEWATDYTGTFEEYGGDDGGGRRSGKKRGGKGQADSRRGDKGKGKGKGGKWRG